MNKQEFLSFNLPYELKMYMESLDGKIERPYVLRPEWLESAIEFKNNPIVRPLSDLTKEEFSFIYENETDLESIEAIVNMEYEALLSSKFSFYFWRELFKNHFDVAGLIEKGEAIDVNTLETNPYK